MIKQITLSTFFLTSALYAGEATINPQLIADIEKAKQEKTQADQKLKALEAQLPKNEKEKNAFITHAEVGYISTSGNTDTQTFNADAYIKKHLNKNVFKWSIDGQYAQDKKIESKNKFFTELTYDYEITQHFALNYIAGYKRDRFSSFDYQFYTGPGVKYTALNTNMYTLSMEGNILFARDQDIDTSIDANDYTSARAKGVFVWQIFENLKFAQELTYRTNLENSDTYFVFSKSELSSKFSDIFSGALSYKVDYVNQPGDKKYTDTTFTLGLIVDY